MRTTMKIDLPNYLFQKYGLQGFYRRRLIKTSVDELDLKKVKQKKK